MSHEVWSGRGATEMTRRSTIIIAALGAAVLATVSAFGVVRAQDAESVELDLTVRTDDSMTTTQQLDWVAEQTEKARAISRLASNMLEDERKAKHPDASKINCLDNKLTEINANLRGIEKRAAELEVAVGAGDTATANQQFTLLKVQFARVGGLKAEAENCVERDFVIGDSETIVEIDEDITTEDPTIEPVDLDIGIDQTVHASGFY